MSTSYCTPKRGGRPPKKVKRQRVSLTLHPDVRRAAEKLAFSENRSLSGLIEFCLRKEIGRAKSQEAPE